MFAAFFSFFDVCRFSAITPARRGKCCSLSSIRSTSADADHRGITYISCIVLNLCIPILHLFSQLYKRILQIQQMTQKPPQSPVTETGAVRLRYLYFFNRSRKTLRGFLIAAWAGAKITGRSEQCSAVSLTRCISKERLHCTKRNSVTLCFFLFISHTGNFLNKSSDFRRCC